jgi:4-amino-4-deoxy-L-arabinose transferase-like glycosyltransferase
VFDSISRRTYVVSLTLITLFSALLLLGWALLSQSLRAPDEPQHANSVVRLMYGGGWPAPGDARFGAGPETVLSEAGFSTWLPGSTRPPGPAFTDVVPTPDDARTVIDEGNALPVPGETRYDQMTQHPPLYYAVVAEVLKLIGLDEARWDVQLLAMRLVSAAMTVASIPLIAEATRRLFRSPALGLTAACLPLFIPQFWHINGAVTNDALLTLTGTLTLFWMLKAVQGDVRYRTAILAGLFLGAGLLTKGFMVAGIPVVLAAFLAARGAPWRRRLLAGAVSMAVAFAVGGWWWLRNIVVFGTLQPQGQPGVAPNLSAEPTLAAYADRALEAFSKSFWGLFSWGEMPIALPYVIVATVIALLLVVVGLMTSRYRFREMLLLASFAGIIVGSIVVRQWRSYAETGLFSGLQGRYFYLAILSLTLLSAGGLWFLLRRSERRATLLLPVLAASGVMVSLWGMSVAFDGYYRAAGESFGEAFGRWTAWSPAAPEQVAALGGVMAAVACVLVVHLTWTAWSGGRPTGRVQVPARHSRAITIER